MLRGEPETAGRKEDSAARTCRHLGAAAGRAANAYVPSAHMGLLCEPAFKDTRGVGQADRSRARSASSKRNAAMSSAASPCPVKS